MEVNKESDDRGKQQTGSYKAKEQEEERWCCLLSVLILILLMAPFQWPQKGHNHPFNKLVTMGGQSVREDAETGEKKRKERGKNKIIKIIIRFSCVCFSVTSTVDNRGVESTTT